LFSAINIYNIFYNFDQTSNGLTLQENWNALQFGMNGVARENGITSENGSKGRTLQA